MKKMKKVVSALAICAVAPSAFASKHFHDTFVGVDVIQTSQEFKANYGKDQFKKTPLDYSIFAGTKFSHHFGVEVGYEGQPKKKKDATWTGEGFLDGNTYTGTASSTTSVKGNHPYAGIFAECKHHRMKFQAMLGASVSQVKVSSYNTVVAGSVPADFTNGATLTGSRTKIVPMVKLSAIHNFTDRFGVRLSVNYRNLSDMNIRMDQDSNQVVRPKDSFGIGLGVVYSFN